MTRIRNETEPALIWERLDRAAFEGVFILERFGLPDCRFQCVRGPETDSWFVYRPNGDTIGVGDTAAGAMADAIARHGTPPDLFAIRDRRAKANPGPWWTATNDEYDYEEDVIRGPSTDWRGAKVYSSHELGKFHHKEDETFVTQAAIDVAVLLIEIDRLSAIERQAQAGEE